MGVKEEFLSQWKKFKRVHCMINHKTNAGLIRNIHEIDLNAILRLSFTNIRDTQKWSRGFGISRGEPVQRGTSRQRRESAGLIKSM